MAPNVEITWWFSTAGPVTGWKEWPERRPLDGRAGQDFWIRVAAKNMGETRPWDAINNLVVPAALDIERVVGQGALLDGAENSEVGDPPDHRVRWFYNRTYWPRGLVWMQRYHLRFPAGRDADVVLLYDLNDGVEETTSKRVIALA